MERIGYIACGYTLFMDGAGVPWMKNGRGGFILPDRLRRSGSRLELHRTLAEHEDRRLRDEQGDYEMKRLLCIRAARLALEWNEETSRFQEGAFA